MIKRVRFMQAELITLKSQINWYRVVNCHLTEYWNKEFFYAIITKYYRFLLKCNLNRSI